MKIVTKYNEQLESFLHNKKQPFVIETSDTQMILHFTEFEDIMEGAKFVTGLVGDIISLGEKYTIVEKLTLDKLIRVGLSIGRGIGGVVNGLYAISTSCFIESLVLAEKGLPGHAHLTYLMKSASGLQPAQVAERAKFNGRVTYILKKSAAVTLDNILIPDDLGPLAGSATDAVEDEAPQTGDGPRNIGIQAEDEDRPEEIDTEEADTPPVPPVEPPKKPPESIVRRRGI